MRTTTSILFVMVRAYKYTCISACPTIKILCLFAAILCPILDPVQALVGTKDRHYKTSAKIECNRAFWWKEERRYKKTVNCTDTAEWTEPVHDCSGINITSLLKQNQHIIIAIVMWFALFFTFYGVGGHFWVSRAPPPLILEP